MALQVVGVGEVLWDVLPEGAQLGGAPANFAYQAHALGARAHVVTRIGKDAYGCDVIRHFRTMGLPVTTVQIDDTAPTGTATVEIFGDGQTRFTLHENVAWDSIVVTPEALDVVRNADAVCFGSLAQRSGTSRRTIQHLLAAAPQQALRIFDINLRQHFYSREVIEQSLAACNVLKLNDDELSTLAQLLELTGPASQHPHQNSLAQRTPRHTEDLIARLAHHYSLNVVALTRGPSGSLLYHHGNWSHCPSVPVKVADTVGAGDAFTATLALGLLSQMDLDEVNRLANEVARYICSQPGATPPLPPYLANYFADLQNR